MTEFHLQFSETRSVKASWSKGGVKVEEGERQRRGEKELEVKTSCHASVFKPGFAC